MRLGIVTWCIFIFIFANAAEDSKPKKIKSWRDKDIRDMNDADLEHLYDEWEKNDDEPLESDELPEHLRPSPKIDLSKIDTMNPDSILRMTKKGKGVMMFVDTNPEMTVDDAEVIMRIWQSSLQNNHIIAERYPIDPKRSVFLFRDGSQAVDAKEYLLQQPELSHITLEGQTFYRKKDQGAQTTSTKDSKDKPIGKQGKTEL